MKRRFLVLICIITLGAFVSPVSAINRAPKKDSSDSEKKATEIKEMTKEKKDAKLKSRATSLSDKVIRKGEGKKQTLPEKSKESKSWPKSSKDKYDYFMDKNNNGIDDRLEKKVKIKSVPKQEITKEKTPVPAEKKPAKITPVEKSPAKVRGEEPKKEKKEIKPKEVENKKKDKRR
jgi:hypothetical protein